MQERGFEPLNPLREGILSPSRLTTSLSLPDKRINKKDVLNLEVARKLLKTIISLLCFMRSNNKECN